MGEDDPLAIHNAQKCLIEVPLIVVADAREKGWLSAVNGM